MFDLNNILDLPPFSLSKSQKRGLYEEALFDLTRHHYKNCREYGKILDLLNFNSTIKHPIEELPFLPVRLFKDYKLLSTEETQVIKTLTSSGTTGQSLSRIFLDRVTATYQTKVLAKIVKNYTGPKRLPMIIVDTESVIKDRNLLSARGAGILGFSLFGYDIAYALDEDMQLDFDAVKAFCQKHRGKNILIFGFTFMIWEYFYKQLIDCGRELNLENGIMIHGGGWKNLNDQAVNNDIFKSLLEKVCGIKKIYNYYGMAEQTGSVFMECEAGHLHSSIFSDVLMRRPDLTICDNHETGLVQLFSLLPLSYPGHVILSEDVGEIIGEDNCPCGRLGKYFKIHGRIEAAEIRGCSDTYN